MSAARASVIDFPIPRVPPVIKVVWPPRGNTEKINLGSAMSSFEFLSDGFNQIEFTLVRIGTFPRLEFSMITRRKECNISFAALR